MRLREWTLDYRLYINTLARADVMKVLGFIEFDEEKEEKFKMCCTLMISCLDIA